MEQANGFFFLQKYLFIYLHLHTKKIYFLFLLTEVEINVSENQDFKLNFCQGKLIKLEILLKELKNLSKSLNRT